MPSLSNLYNRSELYSKDPMVSGIIILVVILFGSYIAPVLPMSVAQIIAHPLIKIGLIILIFVSRSYSGTISLLLSVLFVLSMKSVSKSILTGLKNIAENVQNSMKDAYNATKEDVNLLVNVEEGQSLGKGLGGLKPYNKEHAHVSPNLETMNESLNKLTPQDNNEPIKDNFPIQAYNEKDKLKLIV